MILRSIETSAGIAGKDFGEILRSLARDCDCLSTQNLCNWLQAEQGPAPQEDALVALAGRHVKWTRLAVQQQLIEPDQPC